MTPSDSLKLGTYIGSSVEILNHNNKNVWLYTHVVWQKCEIFAILTYIASCKMLISHEVIAFIRGPGGGVMLNRQLSSLCL